MSNLSQASTLAAMLSQLRSRGTRPPSALPETSNTAQRGAVEELAAELAALEMSLQLRSQFLEERRNADKYRALFAQMPKQEDSMQVDETAPGASADAAADGGNSNPADAITVKLVPEFEEVSNQELKFKVVVSLKATADVVKPANVALMAVVDKSGSMQGQKIDLVRGTVEFLAEQLGKKDAFGLVTYNDKAKRDLPMLLMTPAAKTIAKAVNNKIRPDGCTALYDGLLMGIKDHTADVKSSISENGRRVRSIFLCTDGLPNVGPGDALSIVSAMRAQLAPLAATEEPVSVHTFGFGSDHDPKLLQAIAEAGSGIYYYIQNDSQIPEAFGDALGGLLSVVASNVRVSITAETAGGNVLISNLHSGGKMESAADPNKQRIVKFADLFADENREMLLELLLPATAQDNKTAQPLVKIDVSYTDPVSGVTVNRRHVLDVTRSAAPPADLKRHELVATTAARFHVAEAVKAAGAESDAGRFEGAEQLLEDAKQKVKEQETGESEWVLVEQLDDMAKAVKAAKHARHNVQYQAAVSTRLHSYSHAMQSQRATASHFSMAAVPAPQAPYQGIQWQQQQRAAPNWGGAMQQQQLAAPGVGWGSAVPLNAAIFGAAAAAAPPPPATTSMPFMSSTNAMRTKMSSNASEFVSKRSKQ